VNLDQPEQTDLPENKAAKVNKVTEENVVPRGCLDLLVPPVNLENRVTRVPLVRMVCLDCKDDLETEDHLDLPVHLEQPVCLVYRA